VSRRFSAAAAAILVPFAAVALWNAVRYPPGLGYDAPQHIQYAELLVERGDLPAGGEQSYTQFYTPPLYYAVAGAATEAGEALGIGDPRRVALAVNALIALGTALLLLALARTVWPGRPVLHLAALGFFAFGALVLKTAAMFHPEILSLFLSTLALLLAARMLVARRFDAWQALALGIALGLAQLVRAWSLWTFGVVVVTLVAAALLDRERRRRILVAGAWVVAATVVVTAPWYVHQQLRYSTPLPFNRSQPSEPLWERRPASFYADPGLPEVVTAPYRPHFTNRFWPTLYAEGWGDWFGIFAWNSSEGPPSPAERRELVAQSVVGIVPTGLAFGGLLYLLGHLRRRPERLLVALVPLAGIAGLLYFTVSYPSPDGDVIKATYMITAVPAWALAFGLAVDRVSLRSRVLGLALGAALVVSAVVSLAFATFAS
jgi:hypothetical protein